MNAAFQIEGVRLAVSRGESTASEFYALRSKIERDGGLSEEDALTLLGMLERATEGVSGEPLGAKRPNLDKIIEDAVSRVEDAVSDAAAGIRYAADGIGDKIRKALKEAGAS